MSSAAELSPIQLMEIQINTLFRCTADGRLRSVNEHEPDGTDLPAPRFFMGRTGESNLWRFRHDLPSAIVAQLAQLCQAEPVTDDPTNPPQQQDSIRAVLAQQAPLQAEDRGPAYWIPAGIQPAGSAIIISETNVNVLQVEFPWLLQRPSYLDVGPVAASLVDGSAVAVCFCARVPGQATEAGVECIERFRGRGHASAAVAAWAAAVRGRGCIPLYSTGWENVASQGVARRLGMVRYGEDWSLT